MTGASPASSRDHVHDRTSHIPAPRLISGLGEVAAGYDLILCDVWGVVHNGEAPHPGALDALLRFRAGGGTVILLSNAPVPHGSVRHRLDRLRVPRQAYDAIVTSGDITVSFILERGDAPLFNIGPIFDRSLYREVRKFQGEARRVKLEDAAYVVCTGLFDPYSETLADYDPMLAQMLMRRLDFVCANPDIVVHVGPKLMYCAGAIAGRYETAGGKVIQGGKPYPPIYTRAFGMAAALGRPIERSRVLAIGDAMQTDIKGAIGHSLDSLFIASGIHQEQLLKSGIGGELDLAGLGALVQAAGFAPSAVLPALKW